MQQGREIPWKNSVHFKQELFFLHGRIKKQGLIKLTFKVFQVLRLLQKIFLSYNWFLYWKNNNPLGSKVLEKRCWNFQGPKSFLIKRTLRFSRMLLAKKSSILCSHFFYTYYALKKYYIICSNIWIGKNTKWPFHQILLLLFLIYILRTLNHLIQFT